MHSQHQIQLYRSTNAFTYLPQTAALSTLMMASVDSSKVGRGLVSTATLYGPRKTAACMLLLLSFMMIMLASKKREV